MRGRPPDGGRNRGGRYGRLVDSFAGFVPAGSPRITGMVVVDDTPDYGAAASAPTFVTIARDFVQEMDIPPKPMRRSGAG